MPKPPSSTGMVSMSASAVSIGEAEPSKARSAIARARPDAGPRHAVAAKSRSPATVITGAAPYATPWPGPRSR